MINYSQLNSLIDLLGKSVIDPIRLDYEKDSTQKVIELVEAWNTKNYEQLEHISHSLKSSSLNMGMQIFAEKCQCIESAAGQQNALDIANVIDDLSDLHQQSLKELQAFFVN